MSSLPAGEPDQKFTDALAKVKPLLAMQPPLPREQLAEALQLAAVSSLGLGRLDDAQSYWRRAIETNPAFVDAYLNLGKLLKGLDRLPDLEQLYRQLLAVHPDFADAHNHLGSALQDQGRPAEAEASYRRAATLSPERAEFHYNLGVVLRPLGRWDEAAEAYRRAVATSPDFVIAHSNLGNVLKELGRLPEAETAYRQALAIRPGYPVAKFALALLLISVGRFDEGWRLYEGRHDDPTSPQYTTQQVLRRPHWQGQPLAGKKLLVWQEGGLGDAIHFGRYFPMLKALGPIEIAFACSATLHRLFDTVEGVDVVLSHEAGLTAAAQYDYWLSPLSAPLHLGTTLDNIPLPVQFKLARPWLESWGAYLAALPPGPKIGLVWKGNPKHHNDAHRSLPALAMLAPLWRIPDANLNFVSLQKGAGEDEARTPPPDQPLLHLGTDVADLADSAAIVAQLDLVICVDTSLAHLAASAGTPCWVLLPPEDVDWRWMHERTDSPWYPQTVRLFRQPLNGKWRDLIERVREALAARFTPR
ncbi:tetratricopeptide repeat protein [Paraburkholderia sp. BCC1886]|uniref:tetratricopeptide repeat protein n=1 Tax=Paraburkholderia sp. BCC1886 TaxID=2562670 RepID=UPI001182B874|nr:tetratricopeptide repeat protein [Paraburkholderia sp. BCC1886]